MAKKKSAEEIAVAAMALASADFTVVPDDDGAVYEVAKALSQTYIREGERIEIIRVLRVPADSLPGFAKAVEREREAARGLN